MKTRHIYTAILMAAAALAPLEASAQQQELPPEVQEWVNEMQELQAQLETVQAEALADTAIQRQQEEVADVVRAAMIDVDPSLEEGLDRMEQLIAEARVAQEAADAQKITELTAEAQTLQPKIEQAQQQAMSVPAVQEQITEFQDRLQERMVEIDPEARTKLARLQELDARVRAVIGGV